jgi:hypothetical protein
MSNTIKIYVELLNEGTPTIRPTEAEKLGNNLFKILPTPKYNPETETWQFLPGTVVKCEEREDEKEKYLVAVEKVQ